MKLTQPITLLLLFFATWPALANGMVLDPFKFGASSPTPDILWWKFTDGSGSTITATVGGNGTTDCTWGTGKSGSGFCLVGNGTTQEASSSANVTFGANIITLTMWLKVTAWSGLQYIAIGDSVTDTFEFLINSTPRGQLRGTTGVRTETISSPAADTWIHLGVVYDNSTSAGDLKIYIDGTLQSESVTVNTKTGTSNFAAQKLILFSLTVAGSFRLTGSIDDVRIYSGDKSADMTAIMNDAQ